MFAATASPSRGSTSAMTTLAPSCANSRASHSPMPCAPPVMIATLPLSRTLVLPLVLVAPSLGRNPRGGKLPGSHAASLDILLLASSITIINAHIEHINDREIANVGHNAQPRRPH